MSDEDVVVRWEYIFFHRSSTVIEGNVVIGILYFQILKKSIDPGKMENGSRLKISFLTAHWWSLDNIYLYLVGFNFLRIK